MLANRRIEFGLAGVCFSSVKALTVSATLIPLKEKKTYIVSVKNIILWSLILPRDNTIKVQFGCGISEKTAYQLVHLQLVVVVLNYNFAGLQMVPIRRRAVAVNSLNCPQNTPYWLQMTSFLLAVAVCYSGCCLYEECYCAGCPKCSQLRGEFRILLVVQFKNVNEQIQKTEMRVS